MSEPQMMQPTCFFCHEEFRPNSDALIGLAAKGSTDSGATFFDMHINVCGRCRRQLDRDLYRARKIQEAQRN